MMSTTLLKMRRLYIQNIGALVILPLLTFFLVFIQYGVSISLHIEKNPEKYKFYELINLERIIRQVSNIPLHVKSLVVDMVYFSYLLFIAWFISFAYNCYYKLSRNRQDILAIIIEFITLIVIFHFIISPGMPLGISIGGYILFFFLVILNLIYFIYFIKNKA
jgi:hypothetical protein